MTLDRFVEDDGRLVLDDEVLDYTESMNDCDDPLAVAQQRERERDAERARNQGG